MWMDEGFNTFINEYSTAMFNNGEYKATTPPAQFIFGAFAHDKDPLMTPPESMSLRGYGSYYVKTSVGLDILRNVVLDSNRFDYAFNTYVKRWAFKHPQPDDFFRTMNAAAGEDLNWFWNEWFYTTWHLDQAVQGVKYVGGDSTKGALITLVNLGEMAMPVIAKVTQAGGQTEIVKLPVDVWRRGGTWTFRYPSTDKIISVELDPNHVLPDADRTNNIWKAQ
jgi:hypothetical protein